MRSHSELQTLKYVPEMHSVIFRALACSCAFVCLTNTLAAQAGRYWDQNLNSGAALLSGAVVAGESGIAAIFYNPATISEMTKNNLSLSANLASAYFFNAKNALGTDFSPNRLQVDVYPENRNPDT